MLELTFIEGQSIELPENFKSFIAFHFASDFSRCSLLGVLFGLGLDKLGRI